MRLKLIWDNIEKEVTQMRLRNLPIKESSTQLKFSLLKSQAETLEKYRQYVTEKASIPMDLSETIASIVLTFIEDDKEYQSWIKKQLSNTKSSEVA